MNAIKAARHLEAANQKALAVRYLKDQIALLKITLEKLESGPDTLNT